MLRTVHIIKFDVKNVAINIRIVMPKKCGMALNSTHKPLDKPIASDFMGTRPQKLLVTLKKESTNICGARCMDYLPFCQEETR